MRRAWLTLLLCMGVCSRLVYAAADEQVRVPTNDSVAAIPNRATPDSEMGKSGSAPSPLIYPPFKARLPAAHRVHAEKAKLQCAQCHAQANTSATVSDWLGPSSEQCATCHSDRFVGLRTVPVVSARLRFSHAKHAARGVGCSICHGRVDQRPDARGSERLPLMAVCLNCHKNTRGSAAPEASNCRFCHLSAGGVIKTRFREGMLTPQSFVSMRHDNGWLWLHGEPAMIRGSACFSCHRETECVNCHNGRLRPRRIHPGDWLRLHGIEARQAGGACNGCHRSQSECLTCHLRAGLSPSGPMAARRNQGRFHLPSSVWTDRPRTGRHHATQARLHMDECVSCHQERDCASCHATAGVGGPGQGFPLRSAISPHPGGFRATCGAALARNPRPCLVCHGSGDPNLLPCR